MELYTSKSFKTLFKIFITYSAEAKTTRDYVNLINKNELNINICNEVTNGTEKRKICFSNLCSYSPVKLQFGFKYDTHIRKIEEKCIVLNTLLKKYMHNAYCTGNLPRPKF